MTTPAEAAAAFLRPARRGATDDAPLEAAALQRIELPGGALRCWRIGSGPPVLLVHGWEGAPADLAPLARRLVDAGFEAVFAELPAHGGSEHGWTSVPHASEALRRLGDALGALHAVVAHSVGGAVAARAIDIGLRAERAVLIAAPARYVDYARVHAAALGLDAAGTRAMLQQLATAWGVDVRRYETPEVAARLAMPGLIVHSTDDATVPFRDAESIAAAWVGARLERREGLGHRRILSDPAVADAVLAFVAATSVASA